MDGDLFFGNSFVTEGRVKWFCPGRGYGFLECDGLEEDVLLHANVIQNLGRRSVAKGTIVEGTISKQKNGYRVDDVKRVTCPLDVGDKPPVYLPDELFEPARVKWFDKQRNYGFVTVFGKAGDYFLHGDTLAAFGQDEVFPGEALSVAIGHGESGRVVLSAKPWL